APDTVGYRPAAPVLLDVPTAVPGYAAPDVAAGMPASPAGDVFGLGAVLVYAATGVGPFGSGAPQVLLERSLAEEPDLTWVPAAIRDPLRRCLAKDPAQRPAAAELAAILAPDAPLGAAEPVPPPAPAPVDRGVGADAAHGVLSKPAGLRSVRAQWLVLAAVVAVLVLIGGLLVARTGGGGQSEPPPGPPKTIVLPSELREVDRLAVDRQGTMWFFNSSSFTRGRGDGVWKRSADNGALSVVPGISPTGILSIASTSAGTLFVGANANELFLGPQPTTYSGILKVPDSAASMPVPVPTGHDVYPHAIAVNDSGDVYVASGGRVLKRLDSGSDSVVVQPVPGPSRLEDVAVNNLGDIVVVEEVDYRTYSVWKLPAGAAAATRMYGPVQDRVKDVAISDGGDVYAVLGGYPGGGVLRFPADGTPPVTVSGDHYAAAVVTKARDVYILQGNPNSVLELPNLSTPNAKRPKPSARSSTAWSPTYAETPSAPVNQTVAVPERGVTYEVPSNWRVAAQTTVGGVASHRGRLSGRGYAQFDRDCSTQEGPLSFIARSQQIADPRAAAVDFGRVGAEYGWEDTRDIRQSDATPFTTASGIQGWMVQTTGTTRPQEQCGVASYAVYSFGFAGPAGPLVAMIASGRGIPGAVTPETARQIFTTVR
ncbi:MAG: hypothetical protein HOQ24_00730, partial [Mycobacteriaceae bacterium]|nr:hypothetical protein [Mycobacteriaceae bacterium]